MEGTNELKTFKGRVTSLLSLTVVKDLVSRKPQWYKRATSWLGLRFKSWLTITSYWKYLMSLGHNFFNSQCSPVWNKQSSNTLGWSSNTYPMSSKMKLTSPHAKMLLPLKALPDSLN